jgi:hypothetical protein
VKEAKHEIDEQIYAQNNPKEFLESQNFKN